MERLTESQKQNALQRQQDKAAHYKGSSTGLKKPQQLKTKVLPLWKTIRSQAQRLPSLRPNSCGKENHFASVCLSSTQSKHDVRTVDQSDKQSVEESDKQAIFHIEDMSSVKAQGKQLYTRLNLLSNSDPSGMTLECQLDTGETCNMMSYDDLSRIMHTVNLPLQTSKVKLRLFDGSSMKPITATTTQPY